MSPMLQFLQTRIWSQLPQTVSRRTRLIAAILWGGALIACGMWISYRRDKLGMPPGIKPYIFIYLGIVVGLILCAPKAGAIFYLWVLRICAIFGFFISLLILTIGFYLIV